MKLKVIIHPAEEGGFWVEAPAIQGCATQGETIISMKRLKPVFLWTWTTLNWRKMTGFWKLRCEIGFRKTRCPNSGKPRLSFSASQWQSPRCVQSGNSARISLPIRKNEDLMWLAQAFYEGSRYYRN